MLMHCCVVGLCRCVVNAVLQLLVLKTSSLEQTKKEEKKTLRGGMQSRAKGRYPAAAAASAVWCTIVSGLKYIRQLSSGGDVARLSRSLFLWTVERRSVLCICIQADRADGWAVCGILFRHPDNGFTFAAFFTTLTKSVRSGNG